MRFIIEVTTELVLADGSDGNGSSISSRRLLARNVLVDLEVALRVGRGSGGRERRGGLGIKLHGGIGELREEGGGRW